MDDASTIKSLAAQVERLSLIHLINEKFHYSIEIEKLMPIVMGEVVLAIGAAGGSFWLIDSTAENIVCRFGAGDGEGLVDSSLKLGEGLAGWVAQNKEAVIVEDVAKDNRWAGHTKDSGLEPIETTSLMCAPLMVKGESLGVITVANKSEAFTADDLDLLSSLANTAGLAIKNAKLVEEVKVAERLARDMELAASIQKSLLPAQPPPVAHVDLAGICVPAKNVGGDYYDYFLMENGHLGICIADVSGHNVGSALMMAITRQALRFESKHQSSISKVLKETNCSIYDDLTNAGLFITAFFASYDPEVRTLSWANGGHNLPILYRASKQEIDLLDAEGMILGMLDDVEYEEHRTELKAGDILFLYTDGITEGKNESGEMFGEDRLYQEVKQNAHLSAQELLDHIFETIRNWGGNVEQYDDITAVVMKVEA